MRRHHLLFLIVVGALVVLGVLLVVGILSGGDAGELDESPPGVAHLRTF